MTRLLSNNTTLCRLIAKRFYSSPSIDEKEIEHFKKLSTEWWNETGPIRPLHAMNQVRVPFIRDGLISEGNVSGEYLNTAMPLRGLKILDVGCGGGILTEALSKLGGNLTGIDGNSVLINVAKHHSAINGFDINYVYSSIEDYSKENCEKYDAVILSEVIEHVLEQEKFLNDCTKCLKPSGSIFVTTIHKTWLTNFVMIFLGETIFNIVPRGTHQYDKFIEPHMVQKILENYNVHTKLIQGMVYNAISHNWSMCSNSSIFAINYGLHAVKSK